MISKIKIKGVACYDDTVGVEVMDLKKVNFFFGFNGSGKSTLASFLSQQSLDSSSLDQKFVKCTLGGYDPLLHHILTFNQEYIQNNFTRRDELKGVFSLSQRNATIDQQIASEEQSINIWQEIKESYNKKIKHLVQQKSHENEVLLANCWAVRSQFSSFSMLYLIHGGSRSNHLSEVRSVLQRPITSTSTFQQLTEQYDLLFSRKLSNIQVSVDVKCYSRIRRLESKIASILDEIIVGSQDVNIADLINKAGSRAWVEQGVKLLSITGNLCPFCQEQTITNELISQLTKLFDEAYKQKMNALKDWRDEYQRQTNSLISNLNALQSVFNPNNLVSNLLLNLKSLLEHNLEAISHKFQHSNEKVEIIEITIHKQSISEIIRQIKMNNDTFANLTSRRKALEEMVWQYMAHHSKQEINTFDDRAHRISRIIILAEQLRQRCDTFMANARTAIEDLRGKTINTRDAIENINTILRNSGFEGFRIAEKELVNNISRYYLERPDSVTPNEVFTTLSEGEKNFIAFLYFYQCCLGCDDLESHASKKKIVVIDDPVSSLDSQALFVITTLIRELIRRKGDSPNTDKKLLANDIIAQVFILTHNFYFYKEVSFPGRLICTDYYHFSVKKVSQQTSIKGQYNKVIKDDYSLLWATLKDLKSSAQVDSSSNIMLSNIMRRILETYVNFVGMGSDAWSAILDVNKQSANFYILSAFVSAINDESHKVSALDSLYYQRIVSEQPQLLFNSFTSLFEVIGRQHYENMMEEQIAPVTLTVGSTSIQVSELQKYQ